jgi:hypothetical protein
VRALLAGIVVLLLSVVPRTARADDLEDFLAARDAYATSEYGVAVNRFRALLDQELELLRAGLIEPALTYYAASLVLSDREREAVEVFERLLRRDPDAQLSVREFSPRVMQLFVETRQRLSPELVRVRSERLEAERRAQEELAQQQRLLTELATRERVAVQVPRVLMFAPFGIGQFANGDSGWAWAFLGLESALLATNITAFVLGENACATPACRQSSPYAAYQIVNLASLGALGLVALAGIVHANVTFRAERYEFRPRPPPPGFERLRLAIQPTRESPGATVGVQLRF